MPLLVIVRFLTGLLSWVILGAAAYLLWSWFEGSVVRDAGGLLYRERDDWRLWTALGLLAWSFLGRSLVLSLLTRSDTRPTTAARRPGETLASATGSTLHVETYGPEGAPVIIFTHGWGMDASFWNYARQDLGDRFRLVLWDLPGLGQSKAGGPEAIGPAPFAADLAGVIEASGGQRPILVGHSIGGMVIQTLIRDHPGIQDRLSGIVLLNTTYTNPLKTMLFGGLATALQRPLLEPAMKLVIALHPLVWVAKWQSYLNGHAHLAHRFGFGKSVTRSQLEHATLLTTRAPPAVEARGNLAMFHWDATGALDNLWTPALVIGGDMDIVTRLEASRVIAGDSEMAALEVVEDVNHLGPMERAERYNEMIAEFALRVQPVAGSDFTPVIIDLDEHRVPPPVQPAAAS